MYNFLDFHITSSNFEQKNNNNIKQNERPINPEQLNLMETLKIYSLKTVLTFFKLKTKMRHNSPYHFFAFFQYFLFFKKNIKQTQTTLPNENKSTSYLNKLVAH